MALYFISNVIDVGTGLQPCPKKVRKVIVGIPKEIKDTTFRSRNSTVIIGVDLIGQHAKKTQAIIRLRWI